MSTPFLRAVAPWFRPMLVSFVAAKIEGIKTQFQQLQAQIAAYRERTAALDFGLKHSGICVTLSHWAKMEELLVVFLALLLRVDVQKAGLLLYSILNFNVWLSIIHDLFDMDVLFATHQKQWNKVSERIRKIKDQRDQLAHQSVVKPSDQLLHAVGASTLRQSTINSRRKSQIQKPMTSDEIHHFDVEITQISVGSKNSLCRCAAHFKHRQKNLPDQTLVVAVDRALQSRRLSLWARASLPRSSRALPQFPSFPARTWRAVESPNLHPLSTRS